MNMNTKNFNPNSIGERIRYRREKAGLTQLELSLKLMEHGIKVGSSDISKYESEEANPKLDTLMCLCDILNVSSDYILFGTEPTVPVIPADLEKSIIALAEQIKACRYSK